MQQETKSTNPVQIFLSKMIADIKELSSQYNSNQQEELNKKVEELFGINVNAKWDEVKGEFHQTFWLDEMLDIYHGRPISIPHPKT